MLMSTKIKLTDFLIRTAGNSSIKTTNLILIKIIGDITTNRTLNPWASTKIPLRIPKI